MLVHDVTPILNVSNLAESFAWFEQLGWRKHWDNQAGSTWMTWWLSSPDEVDALYARAIELGVAAPWPPTAMPWNVHECHIRHPGGHTFRVSARLEEM